MPQKKDIYKGFEIVTEDDSRLTIAGRRIDFEKTVGGKYYTRILPYSEFDTLIELARHVVEDSADFDTLHR